MIKGKQPINVNTIFDDVNMLWKETFQSDATLNFSNPQTIQKITDFTNNLAEKARQREKDQAVTANILKSSIGPQLPRSYSQLERKVQKRKENQSIFREAN
jgi:hypothetical protein